MKDDEFPIGAVIGCGIAIFLLAPWWLLLAAGIGLSIPWWKKWRFKNVAPADTRIFFEDNDIMCRKQMMYLGTTQEGTIRWWYMRDGSYRSYAVPQAIDDGKVYWNKKVEIHNPTLIIHLNGFWAMGNEWPEYYKTTTKKIKEKVYTKDKSGKKWVNAAMVKHPTSFDPEVIKAVESKFQRADYEDMPNGGKSKNITAAMENDRPLMELLDTVRDLELDATGRCPKLEIIENP